MTEETEGTQVKPWGADGRFVKGDTRINRKGRPKAFHATREIAQTIADEIQLDEDGKQVIVGGAALTKMEAILRNWADSDDLAKQRAFVEYAVGRVPQETDLTVSRGDDDIVPDEVWAQRIADIEKQFADPDQAVIVDAE